MAPIYDNLEIKFRCQWLYFKIWTYIIKFIIFISSRICPILFILPIDRIAYTFPSSILFSLWYNIVDEINKYYLLLKKKRSVKCFGRFRNNREEQYFNLIKCICKYIYILHTYYYIFLKHLLSLLLLNTSLSKS